MQYEMTTSFKEQPITDIQDNLHAAKYVFAERVQAINALFTFVTSSIEEKCQRRTAAINTSIALCKKQEKPRLPPPQDGHQGQKEADFTVRFSTAESGRKPFPSSAKPPKYIFCLGNEELSAADRLKTFASRGDPKKHFHRKHLRDATLTGTKSCRRMWCTKPSRDPSLAFEHRSMFPSSLENYHLRLHHPFP